MSGVPESPVREYVERVEVLVMASLGEPHEIPGLYKVADRDVVWRGGVRHGLALAHAILVREEPAAGTETTRFEYRAVGLDDEEATAERGEWSDDLELVRVELVDLTTAEPPFAHLFIERRTVTVTQPVRLGDDGEPVS